MVPDEQKIMITLATIQKELKLHKPHLVRKYKVKKIGVFGSYAYGEAKKHSDIDILVEFKAPIGLAFVDLADELEKILHHRVGLVSKSGIKTKYLKQVKKDLRYV